MQLHKIIKEKLGESNHILATCYHGIKLDFYDCDNDLISVEDTVFDMVKGIGVYRLNVDNLDVSVDTFGASFSKYIHVVCKPKETEESKWEDIEEYKQNIEDYNRRLTLFGTFEANLAYYILSDKRADEDVFKMWKAIRELVDAPSDPEIQKDNKAILIGYLEEYWFAWLESILDEEYKYMNLTSIVWDSWENPA